MNHKLADHLPIQSDKDLYLVRSRQPLTRIGIPISITVSACCSVPWLGLVMDKFTIPQPDGCPLRTGDHPIIGKCAIQMTHRALKYSLGIDCRNPIIFG